MTPIRKRRDRRSVAAAGVVAGVLVFALVGFVVARTRTATGTRHYTSTRLLPLREWGFGTNAQAQVQLVLPSLPGKRGFMTFSGLSTTVRSGTAQGKHMTVLSGSKNTPVTITFLSAGANPATRQRTVQTHQQLTILVGKGDTKVLAPGRSAKFGFFAVESCDGVEVR